MNFLKTNEILNKFGKYVVQQSKSNLTRKDKGGGKLYNSIKYTLAEKSKNINNQQAPNSIYKFGAMKSRGLRKAINKWTITKGLDGVRDKKTGRFLPRKTMQYLITRSIYLSGIKPTMFFTKPFERAFAKLTPDITKSFLLDIEQGIILGTKK
jgi:hypothetical protein